MDVGDEDETALFARKNGYACASAFEPTIVEAGKRYRLTVRTVPQPGASAGTGTPPMLASAAGHQHMPHGNSLNTSQVPRFAQYIALHVPPVVSDSFPPRDTELGRKP